VTTQSPDVPTKKPRVTFTCDESLRDALEAWSQQESRTVSNLCELIVRQAARDAGYLQDGGAQGSSDA
jgi:hypothetical protein